MECRMSTFMMGFREGIYTHTAYLCEVLEVDVLEGRLWIDFKWMVCISLRWHEEKLCPQAGVRGERRERGERKEGRERREEKERRGWRGGTVSWMS